MKPADGLAIAYKPKSKTENETRLVTERYTVRLLSPDGMYPDSPILAEDFAVLGADDFAWSAVHCAEDEDTYPEGALAWFTLDEVRFFAALSLAEPHPRTNGRIRILSHSWYEPLLLNVAVPEEPRLLLERSRAVAERIRMRAPDRWSAIPHTRDAPDLIEHDYSDQVLQLIRAIDLDRLLLRGLYKFLMATELVRFPHFLEESAVSAFISREAVLELLRRKLSESSGNRLKREDVLEDLRETFPSGEPFVEVLDVNAG